MNLYRLALKNIAGSAFRSWVVALCALLVAGLALGTTLIMRGAQNSLRLAIDRLGADIIVVPEGTVTQVETALLSRALHMLAALPPRPVSVTVHRTDTPALEVLSGYGFHEQRTLITLRRDFA